MLGIFGFRKLPCWTINKHGVFTMNKAELNKMLDQEPMWLLLLFCQGQLTQEEINDLWNPRCNHTKNLAAQQRRYPRTLKQIVEQNPRKLLLSMVRVEAGLRTSVNHPRVEYWRKKSVKPDEIVEDPFKFSPGSDLMEEIAGYAMDCRRGMHH